MHRSALCSMVALIAFCNFQVRELKAYSYILVYYFKANINLGK